MTLDELFGKYALGVIRPEDCISWAEEQLARGIESDSLPILAGLDGRQPLFSVEVGEWFQKVLREMDLPWPDPDDALRRYSLLLCEKILAGQILPSEGLALLSRLWRASDYQEPLYALWDELEEDISLLPRYGPIFNSGLTETNVDDTIRKVARQYLLLAATELPERFFHLGFCEKCHVLAEPGRVRVRWPWLPEKLYRFLFKRGPSWQLACAGCGSKKLLMMSDCEGRARYLEGAR